MKRKNIDKKIDISIAGVGNKRKEDFVSPLNAAKKSSPLIYVSESLYNIYPWCTPSLPCKEQEDYYRVAGFYIPKSFSIHDEKIGNFYERTGAFGEAEKKAAKVYGADETCFGLGGTSWTMRAILRSFERFNRNNGNKDVKLLSTRDVHKAVYKSFREYEIGVDYLPTNYDDEKELFLPTSPKDVEKALEKNKNYNGIIISAPNYEGLVPNEVEIAKIAHDYNIPLIVDEAWGAHLGFSEKLPKSAMQCGADICAQSIHKQGGALNLASVIHFKYGILDKEFFETLKEIHYDDYSSTSVNWDIIASICASTHFLEKKGKETLGQMVDCSEDVRNEIKKINGLQTFGKEICNEYPEYIHDLDLTKITIDTTQTGIPGDVMANYLWKDFRIVKERAEPRHVQLITHYRIPKNKWEIGYLSDAFRRIVDHHKPKENNLKNNSVKYPREVIKKFEHYEVYNLPSKYKEFVPLEEAVGRQSADTICCYPPGRYFVVEGETILQSHIDYSKQAKKMDTSIHAKDPSLEKIYVLKPEAVELIEGSKKTGDLWAI